MALRTLQSQEFRSGDYDTGILERVAKGPPRERAELAMLAAAAARFLGAERAGAEAAASAMAHAETAPRWALLGRAERMRRPLR